MPVTSGIMNGEFLNQFRHHPPAPTGFLSFPGPALLWSPCSSFQYEGFMPPLLSTCQLPGKQQLQALYTRASCRHRYNYLKMMCARKSMESSKARCHTSGKGQEGRRYMRAHGRLKPDLFPWFVANLRPGSGGGPGDTRSDPSFRTRMLC